MYMRVTKEVKCKDFSSKCVGVSVETDGFLEWS
jgi:hypothetical protein